MFDRFDTFTGITVVDVITYILPLLWPMKILADQCQGLCPSRMSSGLRIMVLL
jgi:hypothetical protein